MTLDNERADGLPRDDLHHHDFSHHANLRASVATRLADFEAHDKDRSDRRQAAVALVIAPNRNKEACIVLTRRAQGLRRHSGQWALPGGRIDPGETRLEAALRELEEEIGLELSPDDELGRLDVHSTRSGFAIAPIVFWCPDARPLQPDPGEVAAIHHIPLADLARPEALRIMSWDGDRQLPVMGLESVGDIVFCPTAAILHQFAEVVAYGRSTRVAHFEEPRFAWK